MKYTYSEIEHMMDNEGLGYFILDYTDSSIMPDKEGKELFKEAASALRELEGYVAEQALKESE